MPTVEENVQKLLINNAEMRTEMRERFKSVEEKLDTLPHMRDDIAEVCGKTKKNEVRIDIVEDRMKENRRIGWKSLTAIATAFIASILTLISQFFKN